MNRGLLTKAIREAWVATLLFGFGLFCFETLVAAVFPSIFDQFADQLTRLPFFRNIVRALLGTDLGEQIGPVAFLSIAWVHPVALSLIWAHEIVFCTRLPAGEIDRGTVDLIFGLPVSRWRAYITESMVWIGSGVVILSLGLFGHWLGSVRLPPEHRPGAGELCGIVLNLFALYLAVGGLAYLVSSLSERRGRAVGTVFGIVVASFFLNFLAQFWEPAQYVAFLGVLHYYRPLDVFQTGSWPLVDMLCLSGVGAVLWFAGGWQLSRRDICTV